MKVLFVADHYQEQMKFGGGENNDSVLIHHLRSHDNIDLTCLYTSTTTVDQMRDYDKVIVGNFIFLSEEAKQYLINNKTYLIYEHDHKYVKTRDPSKFVDFIVPSDQLVNRDFYEGSDQVVVLSKICEEVLTANIPAAKIHSIGCSLWTKDFFHLVKNLELSPKTRDLCILQSPNPTKNYAATVNYCIANGLDYTAIFSPSHTEFLEQMSGHKRFLFMPTVLETFSRVCAEAKMLGLQVLTNSKMIGMFSESYGTLSGSELQLALLERNERALKYFSDWALSDG